jgi:hypothetical protein
VEENFTAESWSPGAPVGGANNPDFVGQGLAAGMNFDITTAKQFTFGSTHLRFGLKCGNLSTACGMGCPVTDFGSMTKMKVFEGQTFECFYDRDSGKIFSDLEFRKCRFLSCAISMTLNPKLRTTVRNVKLLNCEFISGDV